MEIATTKKPGIWTQHVDPSSGVSVRRQRIMSCVCLCVFVGSIRPKPRAACLAIRHLFQRAFYFNLALGRSYWELPDDLKTHVQQPLVDELRRWDPQAVEAKYGADPSRHEDIKRRREEAIAAAKSRSEEQAQSEPLLTLQERMALAAQRKKEEIEANKAAGQLAGEKQGEDDAQSNEYLEMVRQLQHVDRETDTSGGKWLVR